jgi:transcriptional regulator with XRE-family HTH domain
MENNNQNEKHWEVLVLFLKNLAREKGITQQQIAENTGLKQSNVNRIFSLRYCPSLKIFLSIAQVIEVNFFFEDKDGNSDLSATFEKAMDELGRRPERLPKN